MSLKILLLEDDFEYRSSVSEYLTKLGYEVDECSSGDVACNKIAANAYHLLILDIKVPEVSGEEVLKYARSLGLNTPRDDDDLARRHRRFKPVLRARL